MLIWMLLFPTRPNHAHFQHLPRIPPVYELPVATPAPQAQCPLLYPPQGRRAQTQWTAPKNRCSPLMPESSLWVLVCSSSTCSIVTTCVLNQSFRSEGKAPKGCVCSSVPTPRYSARQCTGSTSKHCPRATRQVLKIQRQRLSSYARRQHKAFIWGLIFLNGIYVE